MRHTSTFLDVQPHNRFIPIHRKSDVLKLYVDLILIYLRDNVADLTDQLYGRLSLQLLNVQRLLGNGRKNLILNLGLSNCRSGLVASVAVHCYQQICTE